MNQMIPLIQRYGIMAYLEMLGDPYHPIKKSRLQFVTYDGRYRLNQLEYKPSTSPFTHEQLRNTIEYFDSNNNPEFKAKKHRLSPMRG